MTIRLDCTYPMCKCAISYTFPDNYKVGPLPVTVCPKPTAEESINMFASEHLSTAWTLLHPKMTIEHLGYLPCIISADFKGTVKEQIAQNYRHGGGYSPFGKGKYIFNPTTMSLKYPGDPEYKPIASLQVRDEKILMYAHAVVAIVQSNGDFDVVRLD